MPSVSKSDPRFNDVNDENRALERSPPLGRTPSPYRESFETPDRYRVNGAGNGNQQLKLQPPTSIVLNALACKDAHLNDSDYFDADNRKRRKLSTSPSESGTEADDEAGLLKGLPAAPSRPRKGLKDTDKLATGSTSSPLLTPSRIDEERRKYISKVSRKRRGPTGSGTEEELRKIHDKFTKRRRAEFIRRLAETSCLLIVGYVSFYGAGVSFASLEQTAEGLYPQKPKDVPSHLTYQGLFNHAVLLAVIYLAYPLRLLWGVNKTAYGVHGLKGIRVPAAFDPAPLLYPVLLPVFVALSLSSSNPNFLMPNLILSISSIPLEVIPFSSYGSGSIHWFLSLIPLTIPTSSHTVASYALQSPPSRPSHTSEVLTLLPYLHQALVPTLGFLTTTSLLPAELQLLSVSLINLLIFSASPQAVILKVLLWIGGLSMFVFCRHVLRWAVEIARVPSWRFRQSRTRTKRGSILLLAIDDYLQGRLKTWFPFKIAIDSSEDDDTPSLHIRGVSKKQSGSRERGKHARGLSLVSIDGVVDGLKNRLGQLNDSKNLHSIGGSPRRRHTIPTYIDTPPDKNSLKKTQSNSQSQSRTRYVRLKRLISLTAAQALALRWFYASYVYLVVVLTIALPVSLYVGHWSLHGNEPVGWALGYLFGDIPSFRLWTVMWNLEGWICLPPRGTYNSNPVGWAESLRLGRLGAANTRLLISGYCAGVIAIGLIVVMRLSAIAEVDTRRKVFHGMMVFMFLPAIFFDPAFAALALALVLAIFLLLDLFRASQLPPLSKPLTYFLAPYVDGRDHRGPVIVSHIFLLIGCAIPLWLSLSDTARIGISDFKDWDVATRDMGMVSGIICVGMGDAAASLIGRRYGRRKWLWSGGKSLEGSLAFALAVVLGLSLARIWLLMGGWQGDNDDPWSITLGKAAIAATGASFTEAVLTGGNDNVVVPIILWLLVRGLRI